MMVDDLEYRDMDDLAALKGVIQHPSSMKCANLAWTALQNGLDLAEMLPDASHASESHVGSEPPSP